MKKIIVQYLERIAVLIIVGASSYALFYCFSGSGDTATEYSIDTFFGTVIILMLVNAVKHIKEYAGTGVFFGAHKPAATLGIAAYALSRICWTLFCVVFIVINHFYGKEYDDATALMLGLAVVLSLPTIIIGIGFYIRRAEEKRGRGVTTPHFGEVYGSGQGTHLSFACASFDRRDQNLNRRIQIVTGGAVDSISKEATASLFLRETGFGVDCWPVSSGTLEDLARTTSNTYLRAFNALLTQLGCAPEISRDDWQVVILSGADQWVLNRLSAGVDVRYYILSCTDMLLYPRGLTVVELSGYSSEASLAVIVRAENARELDYITR